MAMYMQFKVNLTGNASKFLVVEPWGEEFKIESKQVEIIFTAIGGDLDCEIQMDFSEKDFLRIENPSGFRPTVLIDGREDERPAFAYA